MNLQTFVQFRMKGSNQLVTLAGSHNLAIYFSQNLSISPHLFNIRSTDESHRDISLDALHRSLDVETAQLATVAFLKAVMSIEAMRWLGSPSIFLARRINRHRYHKQASRQQSPPSQAPSIPVHSRVSPGWYSHRPE